MRTISATEAKQSLGMVIDTVQREPIIIQRQNRDIAVLMSMYEYEKLKGAHREAFTSFCESVAQRARERGLTK